MLDLGLTDQIATATIETAINAALKDNPDHGRRLNRLKGQVLQVHLIELKKKLTFVFSQQVDVLATYEGSPDCYLSLHLAVLPQLKDQNNITHLIKQEKIELEGDLKLAQQFSQLMADCKPDIEELMSRFTGDIVAHTVVQSAKDTNRWIKKQASKHQSHVAQVLTEEWKVAPSPLEVASFCDQVTDIQLVTDKLEKRFIHLLEKV
ncbi:ubiquinone biosynthesis accessory factor UbiJ [Vibrio algarum]|uniref:Ubiquinone biosynthesis accessory factor UbiJ n=1 Tax=Vibrio algarum TaxID=3020714 RepID=A0ABT4YLV6_9VIBR|nr:SCP2 domain-containing protein [Vibrio sp. KJ40-1]MDB1122527.1 SCP2 domain-containing protein [Vibrio sp. KJ40-1]